MEQRVETAEKKPLFGRLKGVPPDWAARLSARFTAGKQLGANGFPFYQKYGETENNP